MQYGVTLSGACASGLLLESIEKMASMNDNPLAVRYTIQGGGCGNPFSTNRDSRSSKSRISRRMDVVMYVR